MAVVAIIPARGGSERIPKKNIRLFNGKPLIAYSIETALKSRCFDKVIVSTDDEEIAEISLSYGAEIPFIRPASISDPYTGTTAVIRHGIQSLAEMGLSYQYCCCLYATAPLLSSHNLRQAYDVLLKNSRLDYVFSATPFSFPIQRALLKSELGGVLPFDSQAINCRSQDLIETFHDAGQFYWGKVESFMDPSSNVFSEKSDMYILPNHLVQDIDTLDDWKRAELLYHLLQEQNK